jgi:hypothetical protein
MFSSRIGPHSCKLLRANRCQSIIETPPRGRSILIWRRNAEINLE